MPAVPSTAPAAWPRRRRSSATRTADSPTQWMPSGAPVTAARPTAASPQPAENHLSADHRGQHVDGHFTLGTAAATRRPVRSPATADRIVTCRQIAHHHVPSSAGSRRTLPGSRSRRSGTASNGVTPRCEYQSTMSGTAPSVGLHAKRHRRIRPVRVTAAAAQQPAAHPPLFDARPGQRRRVLGRADLRRAHRRRRQLPHRDHVVGRDLHHRTGLRPHPHAWRSA